MPIRLKPKHRFKRSRSPQHPNEHRATLERNSSFNHIVIGDYASKVHAPRHGPNHSEHHPPPPQPLAAASATHRPSYLDLDQTQGQQDLMTYDGGSSAEEETQPRSSVPRNDEQVKPPLGANAAGGGLTTDQKLKMLK